MTKTDRERQRKAPILRFKGFTDDWEQRKLGTITDTYSGGTPQVSVKDYYSNNEIPFIRSSDIHKNKTELYISSKGLENSSAKLVSKGHILYALYGATSGEVDISKIDGAINQAVLCINAHNDLNYFLMLFLSKNKDKIVRKYIQGGQGNLSASIVKKIKVFTTSKLEETKISNLVKILSDIIALYDRKLKLLSQVKKYFLDNLFTKKEYPNLRFKGFTDAWEQRKLLKICKKEDNKRIPIKEQERKEGNTPYFGANGIQGYIDGYTHDGTNILIAEDGANNVKNYPIKLITGKIWVNNHAHVLNVNTKINNGNFLVGAIKKINFYRYLVGSSRYKLTAESLNQVKIKIAKQSEQEKIGELLKNIEDLLTSYENKQQHLTEIKKTLLNTMFI